MMMTKLTQNLQIALGAVAILWLVHVLNVIVPTDLRLYGLRPRHPDGLRGVALAPFLHGSLGHLMANSGALLVLLTVSMCYSRRLTLGALLIIAVVGGGLVWVFGKGDTVHIGASGIIFGLIGFLMSLGVFRREWKALVFSLAVALLYGGSLGCLLVRAPGLSWTGHFFGFLSGVLAAWWTRAQRGK